MSDGASHDTTATPTNGDGDTFCECDARTSRRKYIQFDLQHFSINHAFRTIAAASAAAAAAAATWARVSLSQHCSHRRTLAHQCTAIRYTHTAHAYTIHIIHAVWVHTHARARNNNHEKQPPNPFPRARAAAADRYIYAARLSGRIAHTRARAHSHTHTACDAMRCDARRSHVNRICMQIGCSHDR